MTTFYYLTMMLRPNFTFIYILLEPINSYFIEGLD